VGLTFASDGNWTNHIDNIVNASFKQVEVLRKLKFTLSMQTLSNIYPTFIRPKFGMGVLNEK
jgi:hypothetical protein